MNNSPFLTVIKRELNRIASSKVLIFSTLLGPIIAFLLVQWIFSSGVVRDIPISVVDNDQTSTSRKVTRMIEATPIAKVVKHSGNLSEAKLMMENGQVEAILVLPDELEKAIYRGEAKEVALYINNTNLVVGGNLKSGLYQTLATVSAGIKMQMLMKKGASEYQAIQQVMPVGLNTHMLFNPFGNYAYFLALGLLPVLLTVFTFLGSLYALGMELKDGSAHELMLAANNNIKLALLGKFLPYTFLFFCNAMCMNLILFKVLGTPLNGSLPMILFSEFMLIICYQALAILFLNLTSNLRLSLSLGSAFTMMALTFSGLTFPSMAMPVVAKGFSYLFPYTFWLKVFMGQSLRGEPIQLTLFPLGIMLIFIATGVLSFYGIKQKLINPLKWGKA